MPTLGFVLSGRGGDPKGNPHKPSSQDVVRFVFKAWASISEDIERCSFKRCGISTSLDGSEDSELKDRLPSVNDRVPKESDSLADEPLGLIFDSASDESFDGFTDSD
ncbi:hypothetical protein HPB47_006621 [Ixodes persulcatus]|uniref:Uncharacterized protein n=1 Tax=Ixodes persulcatus TaxID=34615 RepID=A0AC60P9N5_IXOPE|nr:hypothetical protein HPB47_006621 [Ixodes persulcatus]